jgi:V/A-type H+/Na+-transporting ATPase subunit F
MTEIAVIGNQQFTLGFRLAGIRRIWDATTEEELQRAVLDARRDNDISILVMETTDVARLDSRLRHEMVSSVKPTLVAVGEEEDDSLRNKIKQAVGVDLW